MPASRTQANFVRRLSFFRREWTDSKSTCARSWRSRVYGGQSAGRVTRKRILMVRSPFALKREAIQIGLRESEELPVAWLRRCVLPIVPNMTIFEIEGNNPQYYATNRIAWSMPAIAFVLLLSSRSIAQIPEVPPSHSEIQGNNLIVQVDGRMRSRAGAHFADKETALGPFVVSET